MKLFFLMYSLLGVLTTMLAQQGPVSPGNHEKPPIDLRVQDDWPVLGSASISSNGRYVSYTINNQPVGSYTLVLQSTDARWKLETPGVQEAFFTPDSRWAVFREPGDSLVVQTLGRQETKYIGGVVSFKIPQQGEWLFYLLNNPSKELVARNFRTGQQRSYPGVIDYWFNEAGNVLVLQTDRTQDDKTVQGLQWIDLFGNGNPILFWEGESAGNPVFDKKGTQLAFSVEDRINDKVQQSFWHYRTGTDKAVKLASDSDSSAGLENNLLLSDIQGFCVDGKALFINVKEKEMVRPKPRPDAVKLTIWSYQDTVLQSSQSQLGAGAGRLPATEFYLATINLNTHQIQRLEKREGEIDRSGFSASNTNNDNIVLAKTIKTGADVSETYWNRGIKNPPYLVFLREGKRVELEGAAASAIIDVSPQKEYVLYYDGEQKSFFTYEVATGLTRNITKGIATDWSIYMDDRVDGGKNHYPRANWLSGDSFVLLYDQYDIWKVDPKGTIAPVNITNGYGKKNEIVFRLALQEQLQKPIQLNEKLIVSAFNRSNKENGFYSKELNKTGDPERLHMGPYLYYIEGNFSSFAPLKAKNAERYLVRRMSADHSPNYFSTTDFKSFTPLSNLCPEKKYNWLTTELHNWKALDGSNLQGILYKPENFDPRKKYPVILYYYEKRSDLLNDYIKPVLSNGTLNIPWYVSNGYLVFSPDIQIKVGYIGESALNAVVSAAGYLSDLPYINAKKIGIQGMSYGGYETYYIVTHSNLFAAACAASGPTNFISHYGRLIANSFGTQSMVEKGQFRMEATLWQRPDLYIKNSPIFQADKVTTPLLMFHNTIDGVVPFSQGLEFYLAMRRLGKRAWLLEYEEGNHYVVGKSAEDFSIRMAQFFDHYLKDEPAPRWMTRGVPARMKGIDRGLDLDSAIQTPGTGLTNTK